MPDLLVVSIAPIATFGGLTTGTGGTADGGCDNLSKGGVAHLAPHVRQHDFLAKLPGCQVKLPMVCGDDLELPNGAPREKPTAPPAQGDPTQSSHTGLEGTGVSFSRLPFFERCLRNQRETTFCWGVPSEKETNPNVISDLPQTNMEAPRTPLGRP